MSPRLPDAKGLRLHPGPRISGPVPTSVVSPCSSRVRSRGPAGGEALSRDVGDKGHFGSGGGDDLDGDFGFGGFLEGG